MDRELLTFKEMCWEITDIIRDSSKRGFEHAVIYRSNYHFKRILPVEMVNLLLELGFNYGLKNNNSCIGWHNAKEEQKGKIYGSEFEATKYNFFKFRDFDLKYVDPMCYIEILATEAKEISNKEPIPYDTNPFTKPSTWK